MLEPTGLIRYDAMCNAIVECERIDEVMGIRDTAKALKAYLHEAQNVEAELKVARIRLRAERRAGEILREMADGGQRAKSGDAGGGTDGKGVRPSVAPTLADLGISKYESSMFQKLAALPEDKFEAALACQKPLTAATIVGMFDPEDPKDWWKEYWKGMPEFVQEDLEPYRTLHVHFESAEDVEKFAQLIQQDISPKKASIWFPEADPPLRTKNRMYYIDFPRPETLEADVAFEDHRITSPVSPIGRWTTARSAEL